MNSEAPHVPDPVTLIRPKIIKLIWPGHNAKIKQECVAAVYSKPNSTSPLLLEII
tara:strand:- start:355 stop:519 length:165 start_codon:yes stop_codon:yes gene_type:complete